MLNIFIVLVMFVPFYVAIIYKHSGWLTCIMVFLWCISTSALMILLVALGFVQSLFGTVPVPAYTSVVIIAWGFLSMFIGLKVVFY